MPLWESARAGRGRRLRAGGTYLAAQHPHESPPQRPVWRPPKLPPATVGRLSSVAGQNVPKAPGARSTWRAMPHLCPSVGRHAVGPGVAKRRAMSVQSKKPSAIQAR